MMMMERGGLSAHGFFSSIRRNVLLIAIGTLLGAIAGFALSTMNRDYAATVVLEVSTGVDATQTAMLVESAAATAQSPAILDQAATTLGIPYEQLSKSISASVQTGTNLVDLTAVSASAPGAVDAAEEIVNVAITDYRKRSDERAKQVRTAGAELLAVGTLEPKRAESARQASIGSTVGSTQGQAIQDTATLSVASPALSADRTGVSQPVGLILGAAAGALLTSLLALSQGWNRHRRIRSLADLDYATSYVDASAESPERAAVLAISSGKPILLVFSEDESTRETLARHIAESVELDGTRVALVLVRAGQGEPHQVEGNLWEVGVGRISDILSAANRRTLPIRLGAQRLVIASPPMGEAPLYLAGGNDYLALVAVAPGSRVWQVRAQLEKLTGADPIGVLQS